MESYIFSVSTWVKHFANPRLISNCLFIALAFLFTTVLRHLEISFISKSPFKRTSNKQEKRKDRHIKGNINPTHLPHLKISPILTTTIAATTHIHTQECLHYYFIWLELVCSFQFNSNQFFSTFQTSNKLLVGAIDFGTTYSGWAFSFIHEYRSDPTKATVQNWNSGSGTLVTEKTPTCALIAADGKTLEAFGYGAENKYRDLVEKNQHQDYYYFRRFKMTLDSEVKLLLCKQFRMVASLSSAVCWQMFAYIYFQNKCYINRSNRTYLM